MKQILDMVPKEVTQKICKSENIDWNEITRWKISIVDDKGNSILTNEQVEEGFRIKFELTHLIKH